MKILFYLSIAIFLFLFVFFKSNTWQITQKVEQTEGYEYYVTEHSIHWERFFNYIKNIPREIRKTTPFK